MKWKKTFKGLPMSSPDLSFSLFVQPAAGRPLAFFGRNTFWQRFPLQFLHCWGRALLAWQHAHTDHIVNPSLRSSHDSTRKLTTLCAKSNGVCFKHYYSHTYQGACFSHHTHTHKHTQTHSSHAYQDVISFHPTTRTQCRHTAHTD